MGQRLLFDLYSNFTFFLDDEKDGDGFLQHDSRLQSGAKALYQKPHFFASGLGNFSTGLNYLENNINLKLSGRIGRMPTSLRTHALTKIINGGLFAQENLTLYRGKNGGAWQPKASFAFSPWKSVPLTMHANYGRSITSTNARALLADFSSPRVAKSDFYQFGTSHNQGRFSLAISFFWIRRTNELIYVADDGSNEFTGPSTSYGYEGKTSAQITRALAFNASITKVINPYFRDTDPREYIPRAPHFTGYASLTLSTWKG